MLDYPTVGHLLFLFESYRTELYFWESVDCLRRLAMSSLLVILPEESIMQVVFAMLFAAFCGRTFCAYKPILANNRLAEMTQWQLMLLFFGALLIRVDATGPGSGMDQDAFGIILIVILLLGPILVSVMGFQEVWQTETWASISLFKRSTPSSSHNSLLITSSCVFSNIFFTVLCSRTTGLLKRNFSMETSKRLLMWFEVRSKSSQLSGNS